MMRVKSILGECLPFSKWSTDHEDFLTSLAMQSSEVDSQHLERIVVISLASGKTSSRCAVGTFWANLMRWLDS